VPEASAVDDEVLIPRRAVYEAIIEDKRFEFTAKEIRALWAANERYLSPTKALRNVLRARVVRRWTAITVGATAFVVLSALPLICLGSWPLLIPVLVAGGIVAFAALWFAPRP
jgi:hypothetical protein